MSSTDIYWMRQAIEQAKIAASIGEVPVGAVLVHDNQLIAAGHNQSIQDHDPSAHAEMVVLRRAGAVMQNYRLLKTTLYVSLEPCTMCTGLLVLARIERLVFGATDPKAGAVCSIGRLLEHPKLNHVIKLSSGILSEECGSLLTDFFKSRRNKLDPNQEKK